MKSTAIKLSIFAFILCLIMQSASAVEFGVDFKSPASLNESISVSISLTTSEVYDVKIFVEDSADKIISEIDYNGWKNPYYYLKAVFPAQTSFTIRITEYSANANLCARLRKTNSTSYSEVCKPIQIVSQQSSSSNEEEPAPKQEQPKNTTRTITITSSAVSDFVPLSPSESQPSQQTQQEKEISSDSGNKVILNPQSEPAEYTTSQGNLRLIIVYTFLAFCIVLLILLMLRKL